MSYVEGNLVPGETVIYQTRLHWIVMLGHYVLGCLLFGLPGVLLLYCAFSHAGMRARLCISWKAEPLLCSLVALRRF
jgi:hypothetical protein